jgi:hypothetical protein
MGRVIRMINNKVLRNKDEDLFKKKIVLFIWIKNIYTISYFIGYDNI